LLSDNVPARGPVSRRFARVLVDDEAPVDSFDPHLPPTPPSEPTPPPRKPLKLKRWIYLFLGLLAVLFVYMLVTAPLSKSLQPIAAPGITLLSAEGKPIARRGAVTDQPVDVADLPPHVGAAFLAIEDRRFYDHSGVDPWGILRAFAVNLKEGAVVEGGSTLTQQLAKLAFLSSTGPMPARRRNSCSPSGWKAGSARTKSCRATCRASISATISTVCARQRTIISAARRRSCRSSRRPCWRA
jgi:hypothetical protein